MGIQIEANYSKKLGLPGYSSHQYSVTIRTELADINQLSEQSQQIHSLLQSAVDREIQKTGFLPGSQSDPLPVNGNGNGSNGHSNSNGNGHPNGNNHNVCANGAHSGNGYRQRQGGYRNGHQNHQNQRNQPEQWKCSPKQQDLILQIVRENRLDKQHVEDLSRNSHFEIGAGSRKGALAGKVEARLG